MFLRNLCPLKLYSNTRLGVIALQKILIEGKIIIGSAKKNQCLFLAYSWYPWSNSRFRFMEIQFPVKISFGIAIHKLQGQTLKIAGPNIREDCFSHR